MNSRRLQCVVLVALAAGIEVVVAQSSSGSSSGSDGNASTTSSSDTAPPHLNFKKQTVMPTWLFLVLIVHAALTYYACIVFSAKATGEAVGGLAAPAVAVGRGARAGGSFLSKLWRRGGTTARFEPLGRNAMEAANNPSPQVFADNFEE